MNNISYNTISSKRFIQREVNFENNNFMIFDLEEFFDENFASVIIKEYASLRYVASPKRHFAKKRHKVGSRISF